jgi:predicted ArsR family transcriptional regulator
MGEQAHAKAAQPGIGDLLTLPDAERGLIQWMLRQGEVSLSEAAEHAGLDEEAVRRMLETLAAGGFVQTIEVTAEVRYRARLEPKRGRRLPGELWRALEE